MTLEEWKDNIAASYSIDRESINISSDAQNYIATFQPTNYLAGEAVELRIDIGDITP